MTPQERQLIDDLFDRLAKLETSPRDPDAQAAIADGLRRAPNAVYALVQTVLVQDEALKQAEAHIRELEEGHQPQQQSGGFLDSMRDSLRGPSRGSVPNVRPGESDAPRAAVWNTGQTGYQPDPRASADFRQGNPGGGFGGGLFGGGNQMGGNPGGAPGGGGGSFLGTAAATAAGVIGGSMLMNSIRGMMGGSGHQQSFGDTASSTKSPWDNNNNTQSGGDLARDAGLNDVGKSGRDDNSRQSLADNASYDQNNDNDDDYDNNDDDDDYDSDDDGGSDDSDFA
ncbi:DUF2076 domain-containing protein [Bradyrhizobium sp. SYSU BS000235]|uniref:DUF2076 domain-containing protein n=1 Tax=Bradyrhizobium sp. SYSU BS000235 TaxID=3411332 RepID=UPI003C772D54